MLITRWNLRRWLPLLVAWVASAAYVGARLNTGWTPLDEGTLGYSAERVMQGALPQRDFDDVYTGGLARFDAVVFEVLGTRLSSLRLAMFAVFLLWVPAAYYVATRFAPPIAAGVVTLLCVVWSVPTNSSAMPSWYNLFLATFGIVALIRFTETRYRRWLVAAGLVGGLSLTVKIVGLYYIAAALFFFAFDEHQSSISKPSAAPSSGRRAYAGLLIAFGSALVVGLVYLVRAIPRESRFVHFVLPGAMLAGLLALLEWDQPGHEPWPARLRHLADRAAPFALGVIVPVAVFLYAYIASGSVGALVRGVFLAPTRRFGFAVVPPVSLGTFGAALPWLMVLAAPRRRGIALAGRNYWTPLLVSVVVVGLVALAVAATRGGIPYVAVWLMISYLAPCTVAAGCVVVWRTRDTDSQVSAMRREQLWLLVCMTAMWSLVQVPVAAWGYVLYFAPIAILTQLAIVTTRPTGPGYGPALAAGFFLIFGVTAVNPNRIALWKGTVLPPESWGYASLPIPRTGLRVSAADAVHYPAIVGLIRAHSRPNAFIYAAPDCPEFYYLAHRRNPTRTMFDFLDDTTGHDLRVLQALDARHVDVVVINVMPMFSSSLDHKLGAELRRRYPDSAVVDSFVVRWRPGASPTPD